MSILILYDSLTYPLFSPVFLGGENSPLWCSKFVGYNPRQLLASSSTFLSSNFCALYQLYHHPRIGLSEKDIGPPVYLRKNIWVPVFFSVNQSNAPLLYDFERQWFCMYHPQSRCECSPFLIVNSCSICKFM
jgi:hypothetical protein